MTIYNKDQEYTLKVVNTNNEVKEIKYTPDKDMSKPEMIMALKAKYKNFFKLIESKLIESENTDIISKLNSLKDEFMSNLYRDKDKANEVKNQIKQVLQDAPDGTEMCRVVQDTSSGWTSHGSYSDTYTVIKTLKKENGVWEMYGRKKENLDDAVSSIVFNEGILMTRAEAEKEKERQKVNDTSSHRDIINVGTDKWGNPIGKSTNRVDYPNKKVENVEIEKHREDKLNKLHSDIIYNFEEAYKDWGNEVSKTKAGFVNEYMSEFCNDFEEVNWRDYIVAIPEIDDIYAEYKNVEDWEIPEDVKSKQYKLITDYVQNYLNGVYSKMEETKKLKEVKENEPVIVISYGRGTRFPNRKIAIDYYKECIAGTDPEGAENYSYQNILDMLVSTDEPVVYDWDDKTEYDWWVQKGKPTDDISDELLKAHLGESIKKEDLSDEDIKGLDEYTDNEIKKMYDKYCSENDNKKSFEEWQRENVDSALINELEYEFFSNRKKTEDLDVDVDEETFVNGFVGQPLSTVLTYIGDGHDIADKDYDSVVFFPPVDEIDNTDNYDLYVQGLSQVLKVAERFDVDDINIIVDIADYVKKNKDTLLDLFEVDGKTDEEIMEDLVCRVMPNVISGYTTDNVYKLLLNTVKGGK